VIALPASWDFVSRNGYGTCVPLELLSLDIKVCLNALLELSLGLVALGIDSLLRWSSQSSGDEAHDCESLHVGGWMLTASRYLRRRECSGNRECVDEEYDYRMPRTQQLTPGELSIR
jgi:hypothetical protein